MDIRLPLPEHIHVLRACYNDDARDIIALGGEHSVHVLLVTESSASTIASFHVGSRITALAWSSRTISPSTSDTWFLELAAASADFGLHLLTKYPNTEEDIFPFGGGLSGHHGRVNDMTFCGGRTNDSAKYVATVSDDKMLMVWDLHPNLDIPYNQQSPTSDGFTPDTDAARPQPTAYPVSFPHPLTSVNAHPSVSKDLIVSDSRGSIFLTDWRSDPADTPTDSWRHSSVIELIEPRALADATSTASAHWSGSVSWRQDSVQTVLRLGGTFPPSIAAIHPSLLSFSRADTVLFFRSVGATYGSRFAIWDLAKVQGGKPTATGTSFPEGAHRFRWCQTYPDYFAISTRSPAKGAVIHVYNAFHIHAEPTVFNIGPRPLRVHDFDFLATRGIPRIAAAVGRQLIVFCIGVE
ncbi:hypothetical protein EW146_g496 [Bondarzewia mesenterica]|uniref:Uncharacterized protein n=1 Tax=Bondarzewia mesenterica TaxID=1095465 RepID=A0A4S4M761_9AGAM|nr:hypothetical protein EW146_g496 [Bondarzewia mesenterica]